MDTAAEVRAGARFLDEHGRYRGWAGSVTRPGQGISGPTVRDVSGPEPALATFLAGLDRAPLRVQHTSLAGESYTFAWASGYENGSDIRIQGVLVNAERGEHSKR